MQTLAFLEANHESSMGILQSGSVVYGVSEESSTQVTRLGNLTFLERSRWICKDSEIFGPDHAAFPWFV